MILLYNWNGVSILDIPTTAMLHLRGYTNWSNFALNRLNPGAERLQGRDAETYAGHSHAVRVLDELLNLSTGTRTNTAHLAEQAIGQHQVAKARVAGFSGSHYFGFTERFVESLRPGLTALLTAGPALDRRLPHRLSLNYRTTPDLGPLRELTESLYANVQAGHVYPLQTLTTPAFLFRHMDLLRSHPWDTTAMDLLRPVPPVNLETSRLAIEAWMTSVATSRNVSRDWVHRHLTTVPPRVERPLSRFYRDREDRY